MSVISFVVAVSRNGVIGRDGTLPWHLSSDLKRFKDITMGKPMIMGRKTWDSLPRKPLPGRTNIVITRQKGFSAEGAKVAFSAEEALHLAGDVPEVCIIGGGEIYRMFMSRVTRIYLTVVDVDVAGDTHLEVPNGSDWRNVHEEHHVAGPRDSAPFTLKILERAAPRI